MSKQTNYSYQTKKGVAGGIFDIAPYSIDSRINGESAAGTLKYGMGAMHGATPGVDVKVPVTADTAVKFEGLVLNGYLNEMDMDGAIKIAPLQTVGIMRYGKAWARVSEEAEPTYGAALYLIKTGSEAGLFTTESTGNLAINGKFIGTFGTGNIAPVEIYNQKA